MWIGYGARAPVAAVSLCCCRCGRFRAAPLSGGSAGGRPPESPCANRFLATCVAWPVRNQRIVGVKRAAWRGPGPGWSVRRAGGGCGPPSCWLRGATAAHRRLGSRRGFHFLPTLGDAAEADVYAEDVGCFDGVQVSVGVGVEQVRAPLRSLATRPAQGRPMR